MGTSFSEEEELFAAVLALPAIERNGYLERACGGDRELRARVEALLDAVMPASKFLESDPWALDTHRSSWSADVGTADGDTLGDYKLLRVLGEGGGGVVYLADQSTPVKRQVALKIVRPGMDTQAVIARFAAERQALAMMDHPNIARVFDAGSTPSGRPYFVMELVRGIRLTSYCEQTRVPVAERLMLFIQVCQAVAHAHHNGIVHCDIKPSNILVTLHDAMPVVKVIDFGIARATYEDSTQEPLNLALEPFFGTPAYVSPEQIEPPGVMDIDARSDIYSLGVLLYELVTGCTPFDTEELLTAELQEVKRRIREQAPPAPSQRLAALPRALAMQVGARRRTDPVRLQRLLSGDLDWIIMRCLEKERDRRYPSANALILDIRRFLRNEPIEARPPTLRYTVRKFARRNRLAVAAVSVIAAVLIVATGISIFLAVYASRAQRTAQIEAATSKEIAEFLQQDLLAEAAPEEEGDRDLKLRTVLDRAAAKLGDRFVGRPLVEAAIRETLARTYDSLGEYDTSYEQIRRAHDLFKQHAGNDDPRTLTAAGLLVSNFVVRGRLDEALPLAMDTLRRHKRVLGEDHPDTLDSASNLASIYHQQGKYVAAAEIYSRVLLVHKRVDGPEARATLITTNNLALSLRNAGDLERAASLHAEELAISARVLGPEHPDTLTSMNNLSIVYTDQGRFAEAAELNKKSCDVSERVAGPEHPDTLICLHNLASSYCDLGRYADAQSLQQRVVDTARRVLGPDSLHALTFQGRMVVILAAQGRLLRAERLGRSTIDAAIRSLGSEHPLVLATQANLARICEDQSQIDTAEKLLRGVVAVAPEVFGPEQPRTLAFADQYAQLLIRKGDYIAAEAMLRRSLAVRRRTSQRHWRTFAAEAQLGAALVGLGRVQEAKPLLSEARAGLAAEAQHIPAPDRSRILATTTE